MHHEFPLPDSWLAHRVSYGETDTMGVVYYGEYFHYFERGRNDFIRKCGMSYMEIEKRGFFFPVRDAQCRYRASARFDDLIWIHSAVSEVGRASCVFVHEILDENRQNILASGTTKLALVNREGRPTATPDWLRELIQNQKTGN